MAEEHKHCDCCGEHHEHNHEHHHSHEHEHHHDHDHGCGCGCEHNHENIDKGEFAFKVGFGGLLFVIGFILSELAEKEIFTAPSFVPLVLFGISYLIVAFDIIKEAVEGIIHGDVFNENFLMTVASIGAFAVGEYSEGCMVMLLFTIGEFLQGLAVAKSRKSIRNMLEQKQEIVIVYRDGKEIEIEPDEVKIGDTVIIKPGERVEVDCEITEGIAEVDMKALTGESIPVTKSAGDELPAGCVVFDKTLKANAIREYKDSAVSRIINMIEDSQEGKSNAEQFIRRFARVYTPIVCFIALAIIVIPPLFFGGEWHEWIYRGLSALVVSCPCALVISIPLSFFGGIGGASKQGILIKGGNYLEMLVKADTAVFDKTGTITSGKFEYVSCECHHCHCSDNSHRELLKIIAACERYSNHPIAKSINLAFGHYSDECKVSDAQTIAGKGVSAVVDGVKYYVGNELLMNELNVDFEPTKCIGTPIYCANETEFLGDIVFADIIKEDSRQAVSRLRSRGIKHMIMLTGDKDNVAQDIAEKAGIDEAYSKLLPEQKVARVKALQENGAVVVYTGDGINDAPVLAQADVGVAMGGIGSDVAIEASDVVIMGDSLSKLSLARKIAGKTLRIVKENIAFALIVKLAIIVGCAVGIFDENAMWLAVFGDVGVCLIAIANSLRTIIVRGE